VARAHELYQHQVATPRRLVLSGQLRRAASPEERPRAVWLPCESLFVRDHCLTRALELQEQVTQQLTRGEQGTGRDGVLLHRFLALRRLTSEAKRIFRSTSRLRDPRPRCECLCTDRDGPVGVAV